MKNLIRVEDTKLYLAKNYIGGKKSLGQCLDEMPTVNAIEIPDGATNGDVIKALFPNFICNEERKATRHLCNEEWKTTRHFNLYVEEHLEITGVTTSDWWNAPYRKDDE